MSTQAELDERSDGRWIRGTFHWEVTSVGFGKTPRSGPDYTDTVPAGTALVRQSTDWIRT
jgi:hypothetical protein